MRAGNKRFPLRVAFNWLEKHRRTKRMCANFRNCPGLIHLRQGRHSALAGDIKELQELIDSGDTVPEDFQRMEDLELPVSLRRDF